MKNKMEMYISAKTENIMVTRALVTAFMLSIDSTLDELNELKTLVSEAVTNAIIHGYNKDPNEQVRILLEYNDGIVDIEVEDMGVGIEEIDKAIEPLYTTKGDDDRSGLGFTIIEMFADSFEVISHVGAGTLVKCTKVIQNVLQTVA